jgi:hypothetical protein
MKGFLIRMARKLLKMDFSIGVDSSGWCSLSNNQIVAILNAIKKLFLSK